MYVYAFVALEKHASPAFISLQETRARFTYLGPHPHATPSRAQNTHARTHTLKTHMHAHTLLPITWGDVLTLGLKVTSSGSQLASSSRLSSNTKHMHTDVSARCVGTECDVDICIAQSTEMASVGLPFSATLHRVCQCTRA